MLRRNEAVRWSYSRTSGAMVYSGGCYIRTNESHDQTDHRGEGLPQSHSAYVYVSMQRMKQTGGLRVTIYDPERAEDCEISLDGPSLALFPPTSEQVRRKVCPSLTARSVTPPALS